MQCLVAVGTVASRKCEPDRLCPMGVSSVIVDSSGGQASSGEQVGQVIYVVAGMSEVEGQAITAGP